MNKIISYVSEPVPWRGMKIFFLGIVISTPLSLIRLYFEVENRIFVSISIILFLIGFGVSVIGCANHYKYFKKSINEIDEGYKVKQPWEK